MQRGGGITGGNENKAYIKNCRNEGLVKAGSSGGGIAGDINYASEISGCSNAGDIVWNKTSHGYFGGLIGKTSQTPSATITNCYNIGSIIVSGSRSYNDYFGGLIGYATRLTSLENCYSIGEINVSNVRDGDYIGNLIGGKGYSDSSAPTITNCYYNSSNSSYGALNKAALNGVTEKDDRAFASGEVTYLLNGSKSTDDVVWKQTLSTDAAPNFTGLTVYYDGTKYYNIVTTPEIALTTSKVTVENLSGSADLIVASYADKKLINVKSVPVSADCEKTLSEIGLNLTGADEIKAFLWEDISGMEPLCESCPVDYTDNSGAFDGEEVPLI